MIVIERKLYYVVIDCISGVVSDSKVQVGASDGHKVDGKGHQEVIHWHHRYVQFEIRL